MVISRTVSGWVMPPSTCSMISRHWSSGFPSTRPSPTSRAAPICSARRMKLHARYAVGCGRSSACRARSAGAQSALGRKPADAQVFGPTLRHLADRVASRLRAKSRPGRTVTVRVRFADLRSVTRSVTLDAPISATAILAEIAEELVRTVLADHSDEKTISLLAISVAHLERHWDVQLELPLGLEDEKRRPGAKR